MTKRPNLASALHEAGARPAQVPSHHPSAASADAPAGPALHSAPSEVRKAGKAPTREGLRAVTFYIKPEAHKQLRLLSVDAGSSAQDLLTDAMNELFRKHGLPQIG